MSSNKQQQEHTIDPSLSFELKYHNELHHVSKSEIHDASKPVLQTSTDSVLKQEQAHSTLNLIASNIADKAAQFTHAAQDKISALTSSSTPNKLESSSSSSMPSVIHTLPADVRREVVQHAPLHHVTKAEIDDQSAPVLSTPTDNMQQPSSTSSISASLSSAAHVTADKLSAVGSSISASADKLFDKVMGAVTPKSSQSSMSSSSMPQVIHTLPAQVREEVVSHPSLHHVPASQIDDQSAPVLSTPTDNLLPKTQASSSISESISSTAHSVAASLEHMAGTISHKASDLYQSIAHPSQSTSTVSSTPAEQHKLAPEMKAEVLHHAPLHHVEKSQIDDQSAPVLSTPTDAELAKREAPLSTKIQSSLSSAASTVAAQLPSSQQVKSSLTSAANTVSSTVSSGAHAAAAQLPSSEQVKSSLSSAAASVSSTAHVAADKVSASLPSSQQVSSSLSSAANVTKDKLAQVGSSISAAYTDATKSSSTSTTVAAHTIAPQLADDIKHHQPHLNHVETNDHSAPVLTQSSESKSSSASHNIAHHNIGIATPQNPHVTLHPGKQDLSHVESTIPADHSGNMLAKNTLDSRNIEVNQGGLAWAVPLNQSPLPNNSPSA